MRIAQVSPLYESVPPALYGGTERVVSTLTEELVRLGHDVTLFASGDSITRARLRPASTRALRLDPRCRDPLAPHLLMLGQVYEQAYLFDIIHCHTDYLTLPFTRFTPTPSVITLHGRLDMPELVPLYTEYAEVPLVSISDAQRAPLADANWIGTAYHGLSPDSYRFHAGPGSALVFLGRISPEKRPDSAIRIACASGLPLRIAAKVDNVDREYFESTVKPLLNHPLVEFVGEVDEAGKRALLSDAIALLFPVDWPEPFGLVIIEALASGTPVIARRRGSVPELVRDGVTGFIRQTDDELLEAVRQVHTLKRAACREDFERRFTAAAMAQRYVAIYNRMLGARRSRARTAAGQASQVHDA